jgi:hypothetical protein
MLNKLLAADNMCISSFGVGLMDSCHTQKKNHFMNCCKDLGV